jgi:hypothetical protein
MLPGMGDVRHPLCIHTGCKTRPIYGNSGEKPKYCKKHMLPNMVNVVDKLCNHIGCKTQPIFGLPGMSQERCKKHILPGMINDVDKKCDSCGIFRVVKQNNYLCSYCSPNKKQNTKEMLVKDLLDKHNFKFIHNKEIGNSACN